MNFPEPDPVSPGGPMLGPLNQQMRHLLLNAPPNQGPGPAGPPPGKPFPEQMGITLQELIGMRMPPPLPLPSVPLPPMDPMISSRPARPSAEKSERMKLKESIMAQCRKEDECRVRGAEFKIEEFALKFLERNEVRPLKKKSAKFPKAQYFCRLCSYHCDTLSICIQHVEDTRHSKLSKTQQLETTLYHLPKPNRHHLDVLDQLLHTVAKDLGLPAAETHRRLAVADQLEDILRTAIPECQVTVFGSSVNGFGLVNSSVNMDLKLPEGVPHHVGLSTAFEVIRRCHRFDNVRQDFFSKIPMISFSIGGVPFELSLNNHGAIQTSRLLRDYVNLDPRVRVLGVCLRYWANMCRIDQQSEGFLPSHAFPLLLVHFLQQEKKPVLPCIHDHLDDEADSETTYDTPGELSGWKTRNDMSVGELWIEMFEYYALGLDSDTTIVSVRKAGGFERAEKNWWGRKLTIEDPYCCKRPLTRLINSTSIFDYINDCFKIAYLYFGCIQTVRGPIITRIVLPESQTPEPEKEEPVRKEMVIDPSRMITAEELGRAILGDMPGEEEIDRDASFETLLAKHGTELSPKLARRISDLVPKNMIVFQFVPGILNAGQSPPLVCTVCGAEGHHMRSCPDEDPIPIVPIPPLTLAHKGMLNRVCQEIMQDWQPQEREIRRREKFMADLSRFVENLYPNSSLTMFGSSANGFAFAKSDLDISMTFVDRETDEGIDTVGILKNLCEELEKMPGILNLQDITSAKVPIIKFTHGPVSNLLECDISMYNTLGQVNTRLLRFYSIIDPRVKMLGYMVKLLAKVCRIGEASRGSLSSYAYILMLLHYLQQCDPPVIPVLQELHEEGEKPERIVEGWNAWFFDDEKRLVERWPHLGKNESSVGQLWLGFLDFYARQFDDRRLVVCIRQFRPLTKFEKMWNSPCIAIEDPFELSHNLGSGVSRKMHIYIKKAFVNARLHFGVMPPSLPRNYKNYVFKPQFLVDSEPPNDRGCRACGKIGHLVRDCPRRKQSDENKKSGKKEDKTEKVEQKKGRKSPKIKEPEVKAEERKEPKNEKAIAADLQHRLENIATVDREEDNSLMAMLSGMGITSSPAPTKERIPTAAINAEDLERSLLESSPAPPAKPDPIGRPPGFGPPSRLDGLNSLFPPIGPSGNNSQLLPGLDLSASSLSLTPPSNLNPVEAPRPNPLGSLFQQSSNFGFPTLDLFGQQGSNEPSGNCFFGP